MRDSVCTAAVARGRGPAGRLHARKSGDRIGTITWLDATARRARGFVCFLSSSGDLPSSSRAASLPPLSSLSLRNIHVLNPFSECSDCILIYQFEPATSLQKTFNPAYPASATTSG